MRLFVGLWPSEKIRRALADLERPELPQLRRTTEDQWHITLKFLGEVGDVDEVLGRVKSMEVRDLPEVVLGPTTEVLSDRALVLPANGLDELAGKVDEALTGIGKVRSRPFRGHLTLARLRRPGSVPKLELSTSWCPDRIAVIRSRTGKLGACYEDVAYA